jgi:hypothetical protein
MGEEYKEPMNATINMVVVTKMTLAAGTKYSVEDTVNDCLSEKMTLADDADVEAVCNTDFFHLYTLAGKTIFVAVEDEVVSQ